uniref:Uncharacterized protein n=1 Tax=Corvus moneduloides TaxID=1196302 RepID=A0A8C3H3N8_CORMO
CWVTRWTQYSQRCFPRELIPGPWVPPPLPARDSRSPLQPRALPQALPAAPQRARAEPPRGAGASRPAAAAEGRSVPLPGRGVPAGRCPGLRDVERLRGGAGGGGGGGRPGAALCVGAVLLALRPAGRPGPGAVPAAGRGGRRARVRAAGGERGCRAGPGRAGPGGSGAGGTTRVASPPQQRGRAGGAPGGRRGALRAAAAVPARRRDGVRGDREPGPEHGGVRGRGVLRHQPGTEPRRTPGAGLLSFGSSIDLDRVQTIMESMGSKLSPGAQQLMDMVRCQQKNSFPLGDKLSWILGKNSDFGGDLAIDGLHSAALQSSLSPSASEPLPVKNHLTSEALYKDLRITRDLNSEVPERGNILDSERLPTQQNAVDLRNDLKAVGSLQVQEQAGETPNVANPQVLLPFLQNLCTQVNHLRLKDGERHLGKRAVAKEESVQSVGVEQQPICSYLEKIISKNLDLMERKLMDYIDCRMQALQTHIDNKMFLLMDLVQNSKPSKISQAHYDSNEGFSNGER